MENYDTGQIDQILREIDALINGLTPEGSKVEARFALEYNDLVKSLSSKTHLDLDKFLVSEDEMTSSTDFFEQAGVSAKSLGKFAHLYSTKYVNINLLRTLGNRLLSRFREDRGNAHQVIQHITITGEGNQTVVGIAGGSLSQSAELQVRPGDDAALIASLEALKINQDSVEELKAMLEEGSDPDSKRAAVRKWAKTFSSNVLSGVISSEIASQAPAVFAMVLGYLS